MPNRIDRYKRTCINKINRKRDRALREVNDEVLTRFNEDINTVRQNSKIEESRGIERQQIRDDYIKYLNELIATRDAYVANLPKLLDTLPAKLAKYDAEESVVKSMTHVILVYASKRVDCDRFCREYLGKQWACVNCVSNHKAAVAYLFNDKAIAMMFKLKFA